MLHRSRIPRTDAMLHYPFKDKVIEVSRISRYFMMRVFVAKSSRSVLSSNKEEEERSCWKEIEARRSVVEYHIWTDADREERHIFITLFLSYA